MQHDTLLDLAQRWVNGTISEADHKRLETELSRSGEFRKEFVRLASLDSNLRDLGVQEKLSHAWMPSGSKPRRFRGSSKLYLLSFSAIAFAAVCILYLTQLQKNSGESVAISMADGFAILSKSVNVDWQGTPFHKDDVIANHKLEFIEGLVQVDFFDGAVVILEGPCHFEIRSESEAWCTYGKIHVSAAPAARGFVIDTPKGKIIDLGTKFGMELAEGAAPEVHVFEGEVQLIRGAGAEAIELTAGKAVDRNGEIVSAQLDKFAGSQSLTGKVEAQTRANYERWSEHSARLRRDPRALVYYTFQGSDLWSNRLKNRSQRGSEYDGAVVGTDRVAGRWSVADKFALDFRKMGSRVRLVIPDQLRQCSMVCWARVSSLDHSHNSLFLTDGFDEGEPHWQFHHTGKVLFSMINQGYHYESSTPDIWSPKDSGKWFHLALSVDLETRQVKHYLNGDLIREDRLKADRVTDYIRFGAVEIGNWSDPDRKPNEKFALRNLNGAIAEFALFSEVIDRQEIHQFYQKGNPNH